VRLGVAADAGEALIARPLATRIATPASEASDFAVLLAVDETLDIKVSSQFEVEVL
jgi:hypothetical protein